MSPPRRVSPGAPRLLFVPTAGELRRLGRLPVGTALVRELGFGPVAAAAQAALWIERLRPRQVVLAGIAGTYDEERLPVGSAACFDSVALAGLGAGEGADRLSPSELGLAQCALPDGRRVHEELELCVPAGQSSAGLLLTVCSASASASMCAERLERFPRAVAEEMEAFGVALACALANTPLVVVRGISNRAGERDVHRWRTDEALADARELLLAALEGDDGRGAP